jgi:hypothetical protein
LLELAVRVCAPRSDRAALARLHGSRRCPCTGGAPTLLIPAGNAIVLGNVDPRASSIDDIAVLGPKQLVIQGAIQMLPMSVPPKRCRDA